MLTARADLRKAGRPKGAFLLVGPSGVGKTETVIQIAEQLYGGKQFLTTINMSEYQEKHTVSRLIGSPPGYVGYGEGGVLRRPGETERQGGGQRERERERERQLERGGV